MILIVCAVAAAIYQIAHGKICAVIQSKRASADCDEETDMPGWCHVFSVDGLKDAASPTK
jgi:hypothetical protein